MEEDANYTKEIMDMLSEINENKEAMRFLYLFVKDVYDDERRRKDHR